MISIDLIILLIFLLPGLVGASVFRILTVVRKLDQFDFVVFALILNFAVLLLAVYINWQIKFSFLINAQLIPTEKLFFLLTQADQKLNFYHVMLDYVISPNFLIVNIIAVLLGIILSKAVNTGKLFRWLLINKITHKTGRINVWQDLFNFHPVKQIISSSKNSADYKWVLVTLKDNRLYHGYVQFYSDEPDNRDIVIGNVVELRLNEDTKEYDEYYITKGLIYLPESEIAQMQFDYADYYNSSKE